MPQVRPLPRSVEPVVAGASSATARRGIVTPCARRWRAGAPESSISPSRQRACALDNRPIARILKETADLLELKGENPFKSRAYRNGADIVANHPHRVAALDPDALREIPGIGKDLALRIREIATTGDTDVH